MTKTKTRKKPKRDVLEVDLCDHWLDLADHRCPNYWREEIVLEAPADVSGRTPSGGYGTMNGSYHAGTWRFCRTHARIFKRDRVS